MSPAQHTEPGPSPAASASAVPRLGCVSYLNARPLIDGVEALPTDVRYDVPGRLLGDLESGEVDLALCPVIDYFRSTRRLKLIPAGGIGCDGPTLTVRLFSQAPPDTLTTVHGDVESHTSIALLRVLLAEGYGRTVTIEPYRAFHASTASTGTAAANRPAGDTASPSHENAAPEAMLLIGDKVVTAAPSEAAYPYQLDLGQAWQELTGLPFVFAIWMARAETVLGDLPEQLDRQRRANAPQRAALAEQAAPAHGWPVEKARDYLTRILGYEIGPRQLQAIEHFGRLAHRHGLIDPPRPLELAPIDTTA